MGASEALQDASGGLKWGLRGLYGLSNEFQGVTKVYQGVTMRLRAFQGVLEGFEGASESSQRRCKAYLNH